MKRIIQYFFALSLFCFLSIFPVSAASLIADNLYLAEKPVGDYGNIAFLVTTEGVVVVDSGTSKENQAALMAEIKEVTDQPIRFLILTHNHFDHTFGAAYFPKSTNIIGHKNLEPNLSSFMQTGYHYMLEKLLPNSIEALRAKVIHSPSDKDALQRAEEQYAAFKNAQVIFPDILVEDKLTLRLGGEEVEISYPGPGHTDDNIVVFFKKQKVLHTGDLVFNDAIPYIASGQGGSDTKKWLEAAEKLAEFNAEKVIPGHGKAGSADIIKKQKEFLTDLRAAVAEAIKSGQSAEEAKTNIHLPEYHSYKFQEFLPMDILHVYSELKP